MSTVLSMDTKIAPEEALRDFEHPWRLACSLPPPELARVGRKVSRFEQDAVSVVSPIGSASFRPRIKIETQREHSELALLYRVIESTAFAPNGMEVGQCKFYVCRGLRGKPEMDPEWIAQEMDNISQSTCDMACTLLDCDGWVLWECVNDSSLVVAERIEIKPEFRGSSLWRELFALSLRHSIESHRDLPEFGYLKAFPLQYEGNLTGNETAFAEASEKLKRLYATKLSAHQLSDDDSHDAYMKFPIAHAASAP